MKLSLTKKELLDVLTKHFEHLVTECVIVKGPTTISNYLESRMTEKFGKVRFPGERKIEAIKYLREILYDRLKDTHGLADSKWAIENWDRWIEFVKIHGRMPIIKVDYYHSIATATLS